MIGQYFITFSRGEHKEIKPNPVFKQRSSTTEERNWTNIISQLRLLEIILTSLTALQNSLCKTLCSACSFWGGTSPVLWSLSSSSTARLISVNKNKHTTVKVFTHICKWTHAETQPMRTSVLNLYQCYTIKQETLANVWCYYLINVWNDLLFVSVTSL